MHCRRSIAGDSRASTTREDGAGAARLLRSACRARRCRAPRRTRSTGSTWSASRSSTGQGVTLGRVAGCAWTPARIRCCGSTRRTGGRAADPVCAGVSSMRVDLAARRIDVDWQRGLLKQDAAKPDTSAASTMRIDVVTLFPELVDHAAALRRHGARAGARAVARSATWNPRDFATDSYRTVDDRPYGGGPGMVMLAEPLTQGDRRGAAAQRAAGVARAADDPPVAAGRAADASRAWRARGARSDGVRAGGGALRRRRRARCSSARSTRRSRSATSSCRAANCRR